MLGFIAGIVPLLVIISVIVTIHELGHYLVARLFNTRIERFSVGFGNILFKRTDKRGTDWCISALPLGGYVKFAGDENIASMMPSAEELEAARQSITEREGAKAVGEYFHFKPLWQRFLVILAGPVANFVLAIAIYFALTATFGQVIGRPTVTAVNPGSAAAVAGIQVNDVVVAIDGKPMDTAQDVVIQVSLLADTPSTLTVLRNNKRVDLTVTPHRDFLHNPDGTLSNVKGGVMGIALNDTIRLQRVGLGQALVIGVQQTWDVLDTNLHYLSRIFVGKEDGKQIGGILGMTKVVGDQAVKVSQAKAPIAEKSADLLLSYVQMIAGISTAIGFLNLLPIPALDGGHLAFYLWQGVTKKPISAGFQNVAFRIAIVLVLGLMLFAAWNDISRFGLLKLFGGA